ncbi:hypothetical protein AN1V17_16080 [Vallitalea sediminicola]
MENNKKYNVVVIGLILVIVLIINQNIKFKKEMEYLQSRVSNMESNINNGVNNLSDTISDKVETILNEQQNIVSNYKFTYNSVDTQTGIVKTLVGFTLKQSDADSKVYLNVSTQNNTTGKDYECVSTNGLNYTGKVELSYKDNYILNMYQKSVDGSCKKLNSYSYQNNVKNDFENRVSILGAGTSGSKEGTDYSFTLRNNTFGEQSFKIKSVVVKAFYEDNEVFLKDVTTYNIVNSEARDKINLMIAAGDVASTAIPEIEYNEISTDEKGDEYGTYMVTILHSETGAPIEYNNYPDYSFKVMITFNNGDVYEY